MKKELNDGISHVVKSTLPIYIYRQAVKTMSDDGEETVNFPFRKKLHSIGTYKMI